MIFGFCGAADGGSAMASRRADIQSARDMAATLIHRGPDDAGEFTSPDGRCALAFRRLKVIDPVGSHQPMISRDGAVAITFNGEIYNFRKLRSQLQSDGVQFATSGDTEVLLAMYLRHRAEMFTLLEGMFSLAIYDSRAGKLLLARDRIGQKPLWYSLQSDKIIFASQARALLRAAGIDKSLDRAAIASYLTIGYIPCPASAWVGLRKLPPGSYAEISVAPQCEVCHAAPTMNIKRYWSPAPMSMPATRGEQLELIRQKVSDAVESHIVSDVPIGVLLSGGVDSAIVAGLMTKFLGGDVRTFTAGFADSQFDERAAARAVAGRLGTKHTELLVECDCKSAIERIAEMYDEPFGDSSALPTFLICQAARQHVTVALGGDGGDEAFGGYDRYRALRFASRVGPFSYMGLRLAGGVLRPFAPLNERNRLRRFVRFTQSLPYPPAQQYFLWRAIFTPNDLEMLLSDEFRANLDLIAPASGFMELYEDCDLETELARAQRHDMMTYLPDDLLVKTDIASMACSLELRAPMLDHRVVELGLGLSDEMKAGRGGWLGLAGGRGKVCLRQAFADLIPPDAAKSPKRGFGVPLGQWLAGPLVGKMRELLLDGPVVARAGIFQPQAVEGLINDHVTGLDDHRHQLWAMMILSAWLAKNS